MSRIVIVMLSKKLKEGDLLVAKAGGYQKNLND
jgi:hypothetical protein